MKNLLLCVLFLAVTLPISAQEADSTTFTTKAWATQTVKKGIIWKQAHFDRLFGGEQEINLIEIDLDKHHKKLKLAGVSEGTKLTSVFAKENNAIVAINGGFFNIEKGGAHDFIKIDHEIINVSGNNHPRANAYLVFDKKHVKIMQQTKDSTHAMAWASVLLSGPLLLSDGQIPTIAQNKFNSNKHPRTAIALKGRKLIFLTADGRNKKSHGLDLHELSKLLAWYGCESAMNLDGGGSTTMYIKDQTDNGIVNYPSDNKLFDHFGERPVANIIYIKN